MKKASSKINAMHRQYFRDIFNLEAGENAKLDFHGLERIFERIDFKPTDVGNGFKTVETKRRIHGAFLEKIRTGFRR